MRSRCGSGKGIVVDDMTKVGHWIRGTDEIVLSQGRVKVTGLDKSGCNWASESSQRGHRCSRSGILVSSEREQSLRANRPIRLYITDAVPNYIPGSISVSTRACHLWKVRAKAGFDSPPGSILSYSTTTVQLLYCFYNSLCCRTYVKVHTAIMCSRLWISYRSKGIIVMPPQTPYYYAWT